MEDILRKSLIDQLMINPRETPILFTEPSIHNKDTKLNRFDRGHKLFLPSQSKQGYVIYRIRIRRGGEKLFVK